MPKKLTTDITVLHIAGTDQIKVYLPAQTQFRFGVMAEKTRFFLQTPVVQDFRMKQSRAIFDEWQNGQRALDRLRSRSEYHVLGLEEARNILNLIVGAILYWYQLGDRWVYTRSVLQNATHMAHLQLQPLNALTSAELKKSGAAAKSYEEIRETIGSDPKHFSIFQMHQWWMELRRFRSRNLYIKDIERKLGIACKPFRFALKKLPKP